MRNEMTRSELCGACRIRFCTRGLGQVRAVLFTANDRIVQMFTETS